MTPELQKIAIDAASDYINARPLADGRTPVAIEADLDINRASVIREALLPAMRKYIDKELSTAQFKREIDRINKQNKLWGFSGAKGQMFFNQLVNSVERLPGQPQAQNNLDNRLRSSILVPNNEKEAKSVLQEFRDYVVEVGHEYEEFGGDPRSKPKPSSVAFFLSYFWQIWKPDVWPVYYTSAVQVLDEMNLWRPSGEIGEDYVSYKVLHECLAKSFSERLGRNFSLYDVEHVFWHRSGRLVGEIPVALVGAQSEVSVSGAHLPRDATSAEPIISESYVPPIVAGIPRLAANDRELQRSARELGTSLERMLERNINAAFSILGFETKLLGQGAGRAPDGYAIAVDERYALVWDAKARSDGYRMGTDDRTIREYVDQQSRYLKRVAGIRNIYYVIVSNAFVDEQMELVRSLKMDTHVNEVCFLEAAALVELVNQKMRNPLLVGLGSDGIQQLFCSSGIITADAVIDALGA